jgi:hypothetical protein
LFFLISLSSKKIRQTSSERPGRGKGGQAAFLLIANCLDTCGMGVIFSPRW